MRSALALAAVAVALAACTPKRIPGTDIRDTPDTRAVVDAIEAYRQGAERLDSAAVLALVSQRYFDNAGTPDPADDIDYGQLQRRLTADYASIAALRLQINIRRIDVDGDKAFAFVFYDEHYRVKTKIGEVAKQASDSHRFALAREDGKWKFLSGL